MFYKYFVTTLQMMERELPLKPEFETYYQDLLGKEYSDFLRYSKKYPRKSIRVNTLKCGVDELKQRLSKEWNLQQIPWCEEGFWIDYKDGQRFDIGNIPEHQLGYFYVQNASSMIPVEVLNPTRNSVVLDMCAAPGSKTSQAAAKMNNTGLLVANDSDGRRLTPLGTNLQRCGVHNCIVTNNRGQDIKEDFKYDYVLVDAPCSGTGTIMKSLKVLEMWSEGFVKRMSNVQLMLAKKGFRLLQEGGTMIYSTCTLEPLENEFVVTSLLNEFENAKLADIDLDIKRTKPFQTFKEHAFHTDIDKTLRINPQDNDSEGFFVAKIVKKST